MEFSKYTSSAFSLRDYVAFLFPGLSLLGAFFIYWPGYWGVIKNDNIALILVLIVGGFILGYVCNVISITIFVPIFNRVIDDPFSNDSLIKRKGRFSKPLDNIFSNIVLGRLINYYGDQIINESKTKILFLCWRDIQKYNHQGFEYLFRTVTLWNFSGSMLLPSLCFVWIFYAKSEYFLSAISVLTFVFMAVSRHRLRREFARNVYRIWFVIHHKES